MTTIPTDVEELLVALARRAETHVYGKHRGTVVSVDDPLGRGRIQASVPAVFGDGVTPWAMPCVPFAGPGHGFVALPEVGDGVWIEFEAGDLASPIWSGGWWADGELPDPGSRRVRLWSTSGGLQVVLDEDENELRLEHPGGARVVLSQGGVDVELGTQKVSLSRTEISLNQGMVKVTTAGASLVNDALKVGA